MAREDAAGIDFGFRSGGLAQGFSSKSLGKNVDFLSNFVFVQNRAFSNGLIDSAVLTLSAFEIGGGGGRASRWTLLSFLLTLFLVMFLLTLFPAILHNLLSNCFFHAVLSVRSLVF